MAISLSPRRRRSFVCRWAGCNNAGHTIYVNNKKYVTNLIPSGVFYNINSIIESEGGTKQNLAKMTVFLTEEPTDWKSIGKANEEHLNTPRPAMSWVYVSKLFKPEVKVEIEATAAL